jgi:predicted pyridoxine 5'-phosphate oxidase superfamily flavin-nucleotide-binding protein
MGVFHEGEREVQRRAGVAAEARDLGRGITRAIPAGARPFLEAQRIAVLAGVDEGRRVWASLLIGAPGFITSPIGHTLRMEARTPPQDPIRGCLTSGSPVGVLVFDPERRRRLRLNGRVAEVGDGALEVRVEEVFGNCPKYIQARAPDPEPLDGGAGTGRRGTALTGAQKLWIERADTFFVASVHGETGADASHRGGQPGFVRVVDERRLRFPDYAGNNMFQTLGNISKDPRVGLLFVDFDSGATLQLTARASILWDRRNFSDLAGAERAVEVEIDELVEIDHRIASGWRLLGYSPFNPRSRVPGAPESATISSTMASGSAPHRQGSPTLPSPRETTRSDERNA